MLSDPKKYFGFTFSRKVNISDCRAFSLFETVTGSLTNGCVDNWAIFCGIHKLGKFIECKTKIIFKDRLTFLKKHQILSIDLIEDFSRNSVNISDCRAFSLFETVTGSGLKTVVILWYTQACRFRPLQIQNNF